MRKRKLYHSKYHNKIQDNEIEEESENDDDDNEYINYL